MKKIVVFVVLASLLFLMSSCIFVSGGNSEGMVGSTYEKLENHYDFTYLGQALQELQVAVGLKNETVTERGPVTIVVGKVVGFLKSYKEKQLKKDEREKITAIFNSVDEISRELGLVSDTLEELNVKIDKNFYATMDAFLQAGVKSSVDARWNEYKTLLRRTSYDIGDANGWPSIEEMNQYANTVFTNIAALDVMTNINVIEKFITGTQDILNVYAEVLIDNFSLPPYSVEEVKEALLLLRGYYLELVSYQIKMALFMVEINQETNQLYARDRLEEILEYITVQNEIYLNVSERVASYAGVGLLNRTKHFSNSSIINTADITIYELTLENTINIRLWWTKDALKDPDALMNGIDQNNPYYTEAFNDAYEWLEEDATSGTISNLIQLPGIEHVESKLNQFNLNYYKGDPTEAGLWRITYFPESLISYIFSVKPQDSPVFTHDSVFDQNKINENLIPYCFSHYYVTLSENTPTVSVSIGAYMPEDRFYEDSEPDSGYVVQNDQYNYHWLVRSDLDFSKDKTLYNIWVWKTSLFDYDIRSLNGEDNQKQPWGITIENGVNFLKDNDVIKLYSKQYYRLIVSDWNDPGWHVYYESQKHYLTKPFFGTSIDFDTDADDAWKYTVKKKYLSFLGRIFDDEYIRFKDYYILHQKHKKTDYFLGTERINKQDENQHAVRIKHIENSYCAPNEGILNSDYYFCFTK